MYVDTSIFMYAAGGPSELKAPCLELLRAGASGRLSLVTSAETLQEALHRYRSLRRESELDAVFDAVLASTVAVLPVELDDLLSARYLGRSVPGEVGLSARDLVHGAIARRHGLSQIVTTDAGFDHIPGIVRLDPRDIAM